LAISKATSVFSCLYSSPSMVTGYSLKFCSVFDSPNTSHTSGYENLSSLVLRFK
jgi:hypothetical protein